MLKQIGPRGPHLGTADLCQYLTRFDDSSRFDADLRNNSGRGNLHFDMPVVVVPQPTRYGPRHRDRSLDRLAHRDSCRLTFSGDKLDGVVGLSLRRVGRGCFYRCRAGSLKMVPTDQTNSTND